jgi:hypothetical protein
MVFWLVTDFLFFFLLFVLLGLFILLLILFGFGLDVLGPKGQILLTLVRLDIKVKRLLKLVVVHPY